MGVGAAHEGKKEDYGVKCSLTRNSGESMRYFGLWVDPHQNVSTSISAVASRTDK